jgi:hypothetical protein
MILREKDKKAIVEIATKTLKPQFEIFFEID